jgi:riboflavin biosynthesis pyrimidine reductase
MHFNRILVESGLTFLNQLIKYRLIKNLYLFKSEKHLGKKGLNNSTSLHLKKIKFLKKDLIKINLKGDILYRVKV